MDYEHVLQMEAYGVNQKLKNEFFKEYLKELTQYHVKNCLEYERFWRMFRKSINNVEDFPFLPVRIFKDYELKSISKEGVFKTMTSSGTTGQKTSKIFLDKKTALNQQKTLAAIMESFLGKKRVPMLIIDSDAVIKDRTMFSARGAGILGFSIFGSQRLFALDETMQLKQKEVEDFIKKHENETILVFGFTFMIWEYLYKPLNVKNMNLHIKNGIMFHGGGWKKLQSEAVDTNEFHRCIRSVTDISRVHDYYGMVEQTGCIYVECEEGNFHASSYSDIIIRKNEDYSSCNIGEEGIIQVISLLPESYPGHSILTEDRGVLLGIDDCKCGRCGKYFKILGRIKNAEIRGCSDTFERNT